MGVRLKVQWRAATAPMGERKLQIQRIDTRHDDVARSLDQLRRRLSVQGDVISPASRQRTIDVFGQPLTPQQVVQRICQDVAQRGLDAVLDYTQRLDGVRLDERSIRVSPEELQAAHQRVDPAFLETVRRVRHNIHEFQTAILAEEVHITRDSGCHLHQRYVALERVGICVPGGAAAYPSTVLMTAVPAQAAGVPQLAIVAPPTPHGAYNADLLATCYELGVLEVYRLGGAQAVAALAYGVTGLARVDKIVGPGNLFVALAKKFVYGEVDIDAIAGPSEVVVVADSTARPDVIAADLLAQAEHAPGASVLVSWEDKVLEAAAQQLERQVAELDRADLTRQSLEEYGALVRVRDADEACAVANGIAPEHLHVATGDPHAMLERIAHAGAVFLGHFSPVAIGDYVAGPSHVLPTGGTARWASGLSSNTFRRSYSVMEWDEGALRHVADDVRRMADIEGLTAHRASIDIRLD